MKNIKKSEMIGKEGMVLLDTIRRLNRRNAKDRLLKIIEKTHPADIAWIFRHLTPHERSSVFGVISHTSQVGEFLSELDRTLMQDLVLNLSPLYLAGVVEDMSPDDAADFLEHLPDDFATQIRNLMGRKDREEVEDLLQYDSDTAGGRMSPDFLALDEELSVEEAIKWVQENSEELEMAFYLYITHGDEGQLAGVLSLRELLTHKPYRQLKNIMNTNVISVTTDTDQEEVAHIVSRYNILAVPVVDSAYKMMGIITVDDIIDVIREEATEDFLQLAGAGKDREILLKSTLDNAVTRAPWLFASWIGGLLAVFIINFFQDELQQVLALAGFIPIIVGMGGNIGTQSSTIVVRGLATGRINLNELSKVVFKEVRVGVLLGTLYGIMLGGVAFFSFAGSGKLGLVVGLSVVFAMTLAATVGAFVPLVLKRLDIDAAIATGPFVATSIDILGVSAYFLIAKFFLNI
ncbi:MAG: magnesium transporter [Desulfurivibrionaceae bacterium]|nr:magnesium transporter [Desulfurivibrionaceae bacterium]